MRSSFEDASQGPRMVCSVGRSVDARGCMPCVLSCRCATSPSMIKAGSSSWQPSVQQYANIAKQAAGSERGAGAVSHGEGMHPSNESGGIGAGRDHSAGHERGFGPLAHRCGAAIEASFGGRKRRSTIYILWEQTGSLQRQLSHETKETDFFLRSISRTGESYVIKTI